MHTSGYIHVESNSQRFTNIDQIISLVEMLYVGNDISFKDVHYILIGLKNTKADGYELQPPATFPAKECDALEYCGRDCPGISECKK